MAIEKYTNTSLQDTANLIDSLGWFDTVEIDGANQAISCYLDGDYYLRLRPGQGDSVSFYPLGYNNRGVSGGQVRSINGNANSFFMTYCYKTKNGLLFMSLMYPSSNESYYSSFLLAKTNAGKIAVAFQDSCAMSYSGNIQTYAVDEPVVDVGSWPIIRFRRLWEYDSGGWPSTPQLVSAPIPTHPSSGTSYIKGALGFILAPFNQAGIVEIDGIKYATNGVLALNDED